MTARNAMHQSLIDREHALTEAHLHRGQEAVFAAIAQDRAERWAELLEGREELPEIRTWAAKMAVVHATDFVRVYRTTIPWITALYVGRYGEAEDYWPAALTAEDAARAQHWLEGKWEPDGTAYLPRGSSAKGAAT